MTPKIDRGLFKYFPEYSALIVNMDSQSTDGTNRVFLNTKTKIEKMTLSVNRQPRGKGANIFALLKLSKKLGAKYIATIDADITTITEKWPKLLLDPIIKKKADFVAPIYTRNRYEGNTTNHFCFPLLYAWFGYKIHQPIGGDFAFNQYFVDYILKQRKNKDAFLYGIDIFLSAHALGGNFRIKEEYLGRKIHKPSFNKIIPMFQQVAATTLFVLSKYKDKVNVLKLDTKIEDKQRTDSFVRKPEHTKIENLKKHAIQSLQKLPFKNTQKYLGLNLEKVKEIQKSESIISGNEWVKILANVSKYIVEHKIGDKMANDIAATISPFFFLRVIAYFEELDKIKNQKDIDTLIFKQAKELRYLFTRSSIDIDFNKEKIYSNHQHSSFQTKQKGGKRPMNSYYSVTLTAIPGIPLIKEGDDLGAIILKCVSDAGITFEDGDVLVVTSKIVSKAEGRLVSLKGIQPSQKAFEIARVSGKDPRIVELMLKEAEILEVKPGIVETRHRLGFICTSAGIDRGNTASPEEEMVSLLPENPDQSALKIRKVIEAATNKKIGVVINDSLGIRGRAGSIGLAVGVSGIPAMIRGSQDEVDLYGKKRGVGISFIDEISAAASLLMGQSNAGYPVVLVHGLIYPHGDGKLSDLL